MASAGHLRLSLLVFSCAEACFVVCSAAGRLASSFLWTVTSLPDVSRRSCTGQLPSFCYIRAVRRAMLLCCYCKVVESGHAHVQVSCCYHICAVRRAKHISGSAAVYAVVLFMHLCFERVKEHFRRWPLAGSATRCLCSQGSCAGVVLAGSLCTIPPTLHLLVAWVCCAGLLCMIARKLLALTSCCACLVWVWACLLMQQLGQYASAQSVTELALVVAAVQRLPTDQDRESVCLHDKTVLSSSISRQSRQLGRQFW